MAQELQENEGQEYWTENFLLEEVLLRLASTKMLVRHGDNDDRYVSVYKYYNQALRLRNWIPISKPVPEFIVNMSDLNTRIISELRALGKDGCQTILKQAVGWIFSNIDSRQYNLSIARKLKVRLDA
jgi:UDP-2,3-diacylglucosamine pyrophosphatase LpxH